MPIEKLTASEEIIMKAVWDCQKEPNVSEVLDKVTTVYGKDWKIQTVSTFLKKLVNKRYLKLQRNGRMYTYHILISETIYKKFLYTHLIRFWYNNDVAAFYLEMIKNGDLHKKELYKI